MWLNRIRSSRSPIVLIWLGTCEFTNKDADSKITTAPVKRFERVLHDYEKFKADTRVLRKVLSLGSDYFSVTFYQTYFYYKPSKYSPFTETHVCNLFTQSRKADK